MSLDVNERVSFLSQAAEYLSTAGQQEESRLGCYYQHTGREIRLKNQVSCFGWDAIKRNCCKTCHISLSHPQTASLRTQKGCLVVRCLRCRSSRKRFPIRAKRHTYYEKLVYGDLPAVPQDSDGKESIEIEQKNADVSKMQ